MITSWVSLHDALKTRCTLGAWERTLRNGSKRGQDQAGSQMMVSLFYANAVHLERWLAARQKGAEVEASAELVNAGLATLTGSPFWRGWEAPDGDRIGQDQLLGLLMLRDAFRALPAIGAASDERARIATWHNALAQTKLNVAETPVPAEAPDNPGKTLKLRKHDLLLALATRAKTGEDVMAGELEFAIGAVDDAIMITPPAADEVTESFTEAARMLALRAAGMIDVASDAVLTEASQIIIALAQDDDQQLAEIAPEGAVANAI